MPRWRCGLPSQLHSQGRKACGKRPASGWRENSGFSKILFEFAATKVIVSAGIVRRFPLETRRKPFRSLSGVAHPIRFAPSFPRDFAGLTLPRVHSPARKTPRRWTIRLQREQGLTVSGGWMPRHGVPEDKRGWPARAAAQKCMLDPPKDRAGTRIVSQSL